MSDKNIEPDTEVSEDGLVDAVADALSDLGFSSRNRLLTGCSAPARPRGERILMFYHKPSAAAKLQKIAVFFKKMAAGPGCLVVTLDPTRDKLMPISARDCAFFTE